MIQNQSLALGRKLKTRAGRLFTSRRTSVRGGDDLDGQLTFSHVIYVRYLDMKRLHYGKRVVKRNRKIHNRFVFGHYSSIAGRLMYDLTEDVVARIKAEFNVTE